VNLIETIVEVTGLEVVRFAGDFFTGHVVEVRIGHGDLIA
jgi:hypothetical protein